MVNNRINGIDLLKFIAALFITNSHYGPLYEGINTSYATLGVQGDALFFFIIGFFACHIFTKDKQITPFPSWYNKKIKRIWPQIIVWTVIANLMFGEKMSCWDFLLVSKYWFVQCIVVSYVIIYFILKYANKYLTYFLGVSLTLTCIVIIASPKVSGSIYWPFEYFIFFNVILLGSIVGYKDSKGLYKYNSLKKDVLIAFCSFILYFVLMYIGKGRNDGMYYMQILTLIPLLSFVYYFYRATRYNWCDKLSNVKLIWKPIYYIACLTLEIYIVQNNIITDKYNNLFPLNLFIVFIEIVFFAYILRVITNLFLQTIGDKKWSIKNALIIDY